MLRVRAPVRGCTYCVQQVVAARVGLRPGGTCVRSHAHACMQHTSRCTGACIQHCTCIQSTVLDLLIVVSTVHDVDCSVPIRTARRTREDACESNAKIVERVAGTTARNLAPRSTPGTRVGVHVGRSATNRTGTRVNSSRLGAGAHQIFDSRTCTVSRNRRVAV